MTHTTTIHDAKTHLSKYLSQLEDGTTDEIIIKKYNKPIGKIIPYDLEEIKNSIIKIDNIQTKNIENINQNTEKSLISLDDIIGKYEGKIWVSNDFDDFDEELEAEFYAPIFPVNS